MTAANLGARLLLVEDDDATRRLLASNLTAHAYRIDEALDVRQALERWDAGRPDLVLLDLGLPDRDGLTVVRRVRSEGTTPILILSARDGEADKIAALDAGADDYVTKPFALGELRARIAALLRRSAGPAADAAGRLSVGAVVVDVARRIVTVAGHPVDLTPREYELLKTLCTSPGRVLTKARLLRAVWGAAYADEGHYLHVYVSRLRRKLDEADPDHRAGRIITAEPGVGYRLAEPVIAAEGPSAANL
jgi:two-component system KDP operon response regulator KdpE